MAEIYQNSSQYVYLDIFGGTADGTPTAVAHAPAGSSRPLTVTSQTPVEGATQRFRAMVGLAETQVSGEVRVVWSFVMEGSTINKTDYLDVVVPLVEIGDLREELDISADEFSDADLRRAERRVRIMIEEATGQSFAPTIETLYATGSGDNALRLPKRLVQPTNFPGLREGYPLLPSSIRVANNGFSLIRAVNDVPEIVVAGGVPIRDPWKHHYDRWRSGYTIAITGRWGWDRVPRDITECAIILIEQILCEDSTYRDRYIQSMTAADWRIQFDSQAYSGTGNAVVDKILAKYQVSNAAVI